MPRRRFLEDLATADVPGVTNLRSGEDDGSIKFSISIPHEEWSEVEIVALIPSLDNYPTEHSYLLFVEAADRAPQSICTTLEEISPTLSALPLTEMLRHLVTRIQAPDANTSTDTDFQPSEDDDEVVFSSSEDDDLFTTVLSTDIAQASNAYTRNDSKSKRKLQRLRPDLRVTKDAGFRVAVHGDLSQTGYLCISCRIRKLGISEEAMKAWGVEPFQYFMLIVHYRFGYVSFDDAMVMTDPGVRFRVVLCDSYKPTSVDISNKFTQASKNGGEGFESPQPGGIETSTINDLFISKPLNELMNKRFLPILRARQTLGSWTEAEMAYDSSQGKGRSNETADHRKYNFSDAHHGHNLPRLSTADHLTEDHQLFSLPLCMMQFTLRHFVRCTEFCLNCHCRIDASFEALKPYVCSKSLCLYQFMHLGFGPSIEWEILSQPFVVDLLISFCYVAAAQSRLKDFPLGLGILTPEPEAFRPIVESTTPQWGGIILDLSKAQAVNAQQSKTITARMDRNRMELIFSEKAAASACPLRAGTWLLIQTFKKDRVYHARVDEVYKWPVVQLSKPLITSSPVSTSSTAGDEQLVTTRDTIDVTCHPYNTEFEKLTDPQKNEAILMLLKTLPDVLSMKCYLESCNTKDTSLATWKDRLSPFAIDILRWLIASNRSCIMQVDDLTDSDNSTKAKKGLEGSIWTRGKQIEERVSGMKDWIQFRFAQGAPDKEQRFIDALKSERRHSTPFPTLFAWHGSPLKNWHGIIREGLNFDETFHGRAFGHGVYLSQLYHVSAGFTDGAGQYRGTQGDGWPQSLLKVTSAIALSEVVNCPKKFVHTQPHLVIDKLDWIQTRYLFVRGEPWLLKNRTDVPPKKAYQQDPLWICRGFDSAPIIIPIAAIGKSRHRAGVEKKGKKRLKTWWDGWDDCNDECASISTSASDRALLIDAGDRDSDDVDMQMKDLSSSTKMQKKDPLVTPFFPGALKPESLPLLQAPVIGASTSLRTLHRELRNLIELQKSTALHELGWYIDENLITNMYQWTVEMHSFELDLPLAVDMTKAQIRSIVLEIRFPDNYPLSPPFIRVIQPRFLDFSQGGGGHVTAGGAICMELLTNNGWSAVATIESVLLQVRMELTSTDPPARLGGGGRYGWREAVDAYLRACRVHGWRVPEGFAKIASISVDKGY